MSPLAIVGVVGAILPVRLHGSHGSVFEQRVGENLFVADDRGPWRVAAQTSEVVLARLRVELRGTDLRLLAAELGLFANTARAATVLGGLLGRSRGSIRLRRGGLGSTFFALALGLGRLVRCSRLLGFIFRFFLVLGGVGTFCRSTGESAHAGRTEEEQPRKRGRFRTKASNEVVGLKLTYQ